MSRIFPTKEEKEAKRLRAQAAAVATARLRERTMRLEAKVRRDGGWPFFRDEAKRDEYLAKCIGNAYRVEALTVHNVKVRSEYVEGEKNPSGRYSVLYTIQYLNEQGYNTPGTYGKRK